MKQCTTLYKTYKKHADTLTPVGIFKRLQGKKKFLLESSFQHETKGKYSFIGANPYEEIIGHGNQTIIRNVATGKTTKVAMGALDYIKQNLPQLDIDLPLPFTGGAIGYVAYDAIRQFVPLKKELADDIEMPDIHFMVYDTIIAYEHRTEKAIIITINLDKVDDQTLDARIETINQQLNQHIAIEAPEGKPLNFKPLVGKDVFIDKVKKAKTYITSGETEQIVLSQRMVAKLETDPFSIYRELRTANPSPYMFYIDFEDYLVLGASPESLVQTTGDKVVTNPIAGTRPRGKDALEDKKLEAELLADPKEIAEHDMLVALSEYDLKDICEVSSIEVPVYKDIVHYEHVMHIVSEVHGTLKDNLTSIDALIACLPAGTVSGAPKVRAMQIINELETEKRGVYAGGIGYIAFNHDINIAIAIRCIVVKADKAYLQAGAGIVEGSIAEMEYEETLHKMKSLTNLNRS